MSIARTFLHVALGASMALGCTHPCDALRERLCTDLGPEGCATFSASPTAFGGFVPDRYGWTRRYNGLDQCQMFGDDTNYASHVLPQVRYLVAAKKDPNTPPPTLQRLDDTAGGVGGNWMYALAPLSIFGILAYSWYYQRALRNRHSA
jgi:hypothetical protein